MKKILFFFAALCCSFEAINAQVNYVATLQHGDVVTQYYGGGAFDQAYNAAEDGDVITLSAGTFSFGTYELRKGITVRGAGIDAAEKTFISSKVRFYSEDETKTTNIEGIVFNTDTYVINNRCEKKHGKINLIKNRFGGYFSTEHENNPTETGPVVRIYNSILDSSYGLYFKSNSHPDFIIYNSYIKNPVSYLDTITTSTFVNCVINFRDSYIQNHKYFNFLNCIFNYTYDSTLSWTSYSLCKLSNTTTCYNCLGINKPNIFDDIILGNNNKVVGTPAEIFKTYSTNYAYGETFELTDEAKETYLGTDGTQIGMQGGLYPYTSEVPYPIITKFESTPETTKDGKLTIDVQVDGK